MSLCGICSMQQQSKDRCTQCGRVIELKKPKCVCSLPGNLFVTVANIAGKITAEKFKALYCPKCGEKLR